MSILGDVNVGGGTQCVEAIGSVLSIKELPITIIVVPLETPDTCKDGRVYSHKAIIFRGDEASAVRCVTPSDVDALKAWSIKARARFDRLDEVPGKIVNAISCPPPMLTAGEEAQTASEKLEVLTGWMHDDYKPGLLASLPSPASLQQTG